jgi:hypothetical protein
VSVFGRSSFVRFVWAVVAFVLAALMIGAGVASRTVFAAPEAQSRTVQTDGETAYTLLEGEVLTSIPGAQTLTVEGDGPVFVAYGRDPDVAAWLADVPHTRIALDGEGQPAAQAVEPVAPTPTPEATGVPTETPVPEETATPAEGGDSAAPEDAADDGVAGRSPVGSDLWLDEFEQTDRLTTPLQLPAEMSVLIASDGSAPAPGTVTLTWPVDRSTPWAVPLIAGGAVVLVVGVLLYILGIRHARRSRGPRRKGLPVPATQPIDLAVEQADKGVVSAGSPSRRALSSRRRRFVAVVPVLTAFAVGAAGCTADGPAPFEASASPSGSPTVIVPESQQAPAVTEAQAERILTRISTAVADADAARDPAAAASRLAGAALIERETNYTLRGALPDAPALPAIPDEPVQIVLPQAFDSWPRSFLAVIEGASGSAVAPTILLATQEDPWSDYKASYLGSLEASANLPDLAASYVGTVLAPPDSPFLLLPPEQVAEAYADIVDNGEGSPSWGLFDTASDQLLASIRADRDGRLAELNQTGEGTSSLTFDTTAGTQTPLAMTTLDGGAIVAFDVLETETAQATDPDAVIRLPENPTVRALTGVEEGKGFTQAFVDQLFVYVPPKAADEPIRVLGYRSNLLEAKVIE